MSNKHPVAQDRYQVTRLNALRQIMKVSITALTSSIQGSVMKEGYSAGQSDVLMRGKVYDVRQSEQSDVGSESP